MQPNVLVVVLDAARRDALEPYGAPTGSSPAVAQLARRGRAHERVYATAPWTVPSHCSMFTGLMPRAAGLSRITSPADVRGRIAPHEERLLPKVMRRAGYATGSASANLWLSRTTGFDVGFDELAEIDTDRNAQIHLDSIRERLRWYGEALRARADDGATSVEMALLRWTSDPSKRPFFWFVNLLECHSPYLPPHPYGGRAPISRLRAAADARRHYTLAGLWRACSGVDRVAPDVLARGRRFYAASIRYMDDWLTRVLESLDTHGVLDETLVVVLSDHGENFGEGGLIGHGLSLDDRLIHVPFITAGPGSEDLDLTSLVDLPREIARACDIDVHPWQSSPPAGLAIAQSDPPVVAGQKENLQKLREIGIEGAALERLATPLTCAVKGDLKLLRRGSEESYYDLTADPSEGSPLAVQEIGSHRTEEVKALRETLDFGGRAVAGEGSASAELGPSDEEVRDLEKRMKLLGYM